MHSLGLVNSFADKTSGQLIALTLGVLFIAWGLWWPTTWLKEHTGKPLRWGSKRRPGPPMSRFSELTWVLSLIAFGVGLLQVGNRGQLPDGAITKFLLPIFGILLVALAFDSIAEITRRKRNPACLALLQESRKPFKKRAHAYTLSAVGFGFLAFLLFKVAVDNWSRFPPRFFGGDGNQLFNAWVPAVCGILELVLIVQAIRYWILEKAQPPGADYLEYPEEEAEDEDV
jgi:multisubunit Na+/H+ antiporter MnhB subunit